MWMKIINLDSVNFIRDSKIILKDLSFDIEKGTFVSIIGSNGSGKSTLINLLYGLGDYEGYINVDGFIMDENNINNIRANVSIVSGDNDSFVFGKVIDELVIPLENMGYEREKIEKRVSYIVSLFCLSNILYKSVNEISNSKRQLVLIAQALISNSDIILLDDCMHQMDDSDKKLVFEILEKYKKERKTTILMTTHNMEDVMVSDMVIVLDKGNIVMDGSVISVFKRREELSSIGVGIPFVIDLSLRLIKKKVIKHIYVDMRKLVDDIWK
jgi:energy-coupling factor transport system ATP-binding protein